MIGPGRLVRVLGGLALGVLLLAVAWAAPAAAHADLAETEPAAGAVLEQPPSSIVLRFTEGVDTVASAVRLFAADGQRLEQVEVGRDGDATVVARLGVALAPGTYVVAWRVLSVDSHPVRGAFAFRVGAGTAGSGAPGDTSELINRLLSDQDGSPSAGGLLAAGRGVSFAGVLICIGWLLFGSVGLRRPGWRVGTAAGLARAGAVGVVGTVLMLAAQSVNVAGRWSSMVDPGAYADVIATRSGLWWALRLLILLAVVLVATSVGGGALRSSTRAWALEGRRGKMLGAGAAMVLALVTALGGHSSSGRWPALGVVATVVHLLALGLWGAGLISVVARATDWAFAAAFSSRALLAVVAVALSGVLNSFRQVGHLGLLTSTDFGRLLLVKLGLVALVVGAAALSRRILNRRLPGEPARKLGRSVGVELGVAALVLVVTSVLVNVRPAYSERASAANGTAAVGRRLAQVVLDPARTGGTTMHVYLTSPGGTLDRAEEITVTATLAAQDIGPLPITVFDAGPNHVTNPSVDLPLPGLWTIEIAARYGPFEEVRFQIALTVRR